MDLPGQGGPGDDRCARIHHHTEKETAGARRVQDAVAWVDGAKSGNTMPEEVAEFFVAGAASNPRAIAAIDWLPGASTETRPALDGGGSGGGASDADLDARLSDPRSLSAAGRQYRTSADAMFPAPAEFYCFIQLTLTTCGTFQLPSMIEGGVSFGQYIRSIKTKSPFGAGSQLASLSAPGDSFWK
jgi:hypothetical protein